MKREFIILNDIRQPLKEVPGAIHLASIASGGREYIIYKHNEDVHIERVVKNLVNLRVEYIEDDNEWKDLYDFALNAGLLAIGSQQGFKVAKNT